MGHYQNFNAENQARVTENVDPQELTKLKNIGPRTARALAEVGIESVAELRSVGGIAAYRRLKHRDPRGTTLVVLYSLHGALNDMHWNALGADTKEQLRAQAAQKSTQRPSRSQSP